MSNQTKPQRNFVTIGFGRNVKTANAEFMGLSFVGGKEDDEYEVLVRRKSDGAEAPLFYNATKKISPSVIMMTNRFKTDSQADAKKPDYFIKLELD